MQGSHRTTSENPPPRIWELPVQLKSALSGRVGRQRALSADGHLVMVLHKAPSSETTRSEGIYFWRPPSGEWFCSENGSGWSSLESLIQEFEDVLVELENANDAATTLEERFQIIDELTPFARSTRNQVDALNQAREQTQLGDQRSQLQALCDHSSEIFRGAELLQSDVQNSIQFAIAKQAQRHSYHAKQQAEAAHRLNILAAVFLPLATISSVFGMNLASGFENTKLLFWLVVLLASGLGACIGHFVMKIRTPNPTEW